jgi:hypothetical protein
MPTGFRLDQLGCDPYAAGCLSYAAFERVADTEFATHFANIWRLAFVSEARIAGDDEEPTDARKAGDDVLDHAIAEIVLLDVAAHILKWQHGDRRLIG